MADKKSAELSPGSIARQPVMFAVKEGARAMADAERKALVVSKDLERFAP